jgi:hypothetical protein
MKFVDLEFENRQAAKLACKNFDKIEKTGKYLLGNYLDKFEEDFFNPPPPPPLVTPPALCNDETELAGERLGAIVVPPPPVPRCA